MSYGASIAGRLAATQTLLDIGVVSMREAAVLLGATSEQAESVPDACKWEPSEDEDE